MNAAAGDDSATFNAQLARLLQRLKRDANAATIAQNYRGTGSRAYRRQLWITFKSGATIDVWLEKGHARLGGVVKNGPTGGSPLATREVPYSDTPEQTYEAILAVLGPWANSYVREARRQSMNERRPILRPRRSVPAPPIREAAGGVLDRDRVRRPMRRG